MVFVVGCVTCIASPSPTPHHIYLPVVMRKAPVSGVGIYGFDDWCSDGICYDNPAGPLAQSLGGQVVAVEWDAVENLELEGASLGIGLDSLAEHAYTNGTAGGLSSLAVDGPDAGTWECGHLYSRMLEADRCSAFVHVPLVLSIDDIEIVCDTIARVRKCQNRRE